MEQFSLLYPQNSNAKYTVLSKETQNDLSIDFLCNALTDDGYELNLGGRAVSGTWAAVTRVTQSGDGRKLTIFEGDEVRRYLLFTPGATTQMEALLRDLTRRLDASKGYRDF